MKEWVLAACSLLLAGCSAIIDYEPATFTRSGNALVMNGVIDSDIRSTLQTALENNPTVSTLILENVEGSVDDEANLEAARFVRQQGLNTLVPSDGLVASGGTDFFLAGVKRVVEPGASVGVHSWASDETDNAITLPRTHPDHQKYMAYYRAMGIPTAFYWYTLRAAPGDGMHWMTPAEITQYGLTTDSRLR